MNVPDSPYDVTSDDSKSQTAKETVKYIHMSNFVVITAPEDVPAPNIFSHSDD